MTRVSPLTPPRLAPGQHRCRLRRPTGTVWSRAARHSARRRWPRANRAAVRLPMLAAKRARRLDGRLAPAGSCRHALPLRRRRQRWRRRPRPRQVRCDRQRRHPTRASVRCSLPTCVSCLPRLAQTSPAARRRPRARQRPRRTAPRWANCRRWVQRRLPSRPRCRPSLPSLPQPIKAQSASFRR